MYHANTNQRKARVSILISDKSYFSKRKLIRDKELQHDKGVKPQEDITILKFTHQKTEHQNP